MRGCETALSIMVYNKPDVLARIAGTFSARGYNIESISANTTMNPELTRISITTRHDKEVIRKLEKQLARLVDVISVEDLSNGGAVRREMLLARVFPPPGEEERLKDLVLEKGWKLIACGDDSFTVEVTGNQEEITQAFLHLGPFDLRDYVRTGVISLGGNGIIPGKLQNGGPAGA